MRGLLWITLGLLLSGCVGEASPPAGTAASSEVPTGAEDGSLRVLVVTPEMEPIVGAQVLLKPLDVSLLSNEEGAVVFDALPPGEYTIVAARPGYKSGDARGRIVQVQAGETTEAKLTLLPIQVATVKYHLTSTFRGFVSCAASTSGTAIVCGRGFVVGGVPIRDPNENSTHPLVVENIQAQTAVLEAKWIPTMTALPSFGYIAMSRGFTCNTSCSPQDPMFGAGGPSPLRVYSWADTPLAAGLSKKAEDFPKTTYVSMRAFCGTGCTASFMVQQPYEAAATVFYGEPAPPDFRFYPQ